MEKKKSFRYIIDSGIGCSFMILAPFVGILGLAALVSSYKVVPRAFNGDLKCIILLLTVALIITIFILLINHTTLQGRVDDVIRKVNEKENEIKRDFDSRHKELENEYLRKRQKLNNETVILQGKANSIIAFNKKILKEVYPFKCVASLYKDAVDTVIGDTENYLRTKNPPAPKAADQIKEMRKLVNELVAEGKESLYKYELLLSYVPNLKDYVKDDDLFDIVKDYYAQNKEDDYDRVCDYLSKEEYNKMSEDDRSQLALERYLKSRKKSKWQIGRDYELYYGYRLRQDGFKVDQYGCTHGVEDLGRDIIAHKNGNTYIIQCKYWGQNKVIREKYIMQLYGTKVEYEITHPHLFDKVHAVFVTNIELSEMAIKFAKHLKIQVLKVQMGIYPVIKCNINNGNKIYHLPFDQQYDRTEIKYPGEFWATTVKEAVSKGFRRAHRHFFDNG